MVYYLAVFVLFSNSFEASGQHILSILSVHRFCYFLFSICIYSLIDYARDDRRVVEHSLLMLANDLPEDLTCVWISTPYRSSLMTYASVDNSVDEHCLSILNSSREFLMRWCGA